MKVEYINPFINATKNLMEILVGVERFKKKEMSFDKNIKAVFDVSAIIGITGDCTGSIVLSFSNKVATEMLTKLLGEPVYTIDANVCDAVSEMVNIIAGNASAELSDQGIGHINRSLPNVVYGKGHAIKSPEEAPCINIIFQTELGDFAMQVSLKFNET